MTLMTDVGPPRDQMTNQERTNMLDKHICALVTDENYQVLEESEIKREPDGRRPAADGSPKLMAPR